MPTDSPQNPLYERYASPEMARIFSSGHRFRTWRRLWITLAESERELGLQTTPDQTAALRKTAGDIDLDRVAEIERRTRHDVVAHIRHYAEQADRVHAGAGGILHLGATSAFITDNTDVLLIREALELLAGRPTATIRELAAFARRTRAIPTLAYTHFQPAQLTTVGKRACLWTQDFVMDLAEVRHRLATLRCRGVKGTTGTQASFLELFDGNHEKVRELDRRVAARMGFRESFPVTGQTYTRKADSMVLDTLSGIAQSASKMAGDLRLLQHEGELFEPFESEQIGSSAMAYKRNPMRAERITGLARWVMSLPANTAQTAATQWLERTLDDSANRRLALPEGFLATDAILVLATNIAAGIDVGEEAIARHVQEQMPFMATERWLMLGVSAGGDRQSLHEVVRRHSLAVAERVGRGEANDLLDRLAADPAFQRVSAAKLKEELVPARYTGRAAQQVTEFIEEYLRPLLERARPLAAEAESAEVVV